MGAQGRESEEEQTKTQSVSQGNREDGYHSYRWNQDGKEVRGTLEGKGARQGQQIHSTYSENASGHLNKTSYHKQGDVQWASSTTAE